MRPTKLILNNFGPFIHEVIDFEQINKEQLFLISGKLVREKLCYLMALFMRYLVRLLQKVEMRELRSHFADGKSMSVEYEFKINDKNLKYLDRWIY